MDKTVLPEVSPVVLPPAAGENITLLLTAPKQAKSGQSLTLAATLQDTEGKPIGSAMVKFLSG